MATGNKYRISPRCSPSLSSFSQDLAFAGSSLISSLRITLVSMNALVIFFGCLRDRFFSHLFGGHSEAGEAPDIIEYRFPFFQNDFFFIFLNDQPISDPA